MSKRIETNEILVVDDEKNMRRVLCAMLTREGFECVEAENGREALGYLEKSKPVCMITDLKMPDVDGLELLERINKIGISLPIIMITAHGTVDTAVKAMKEGAFDYLTKPFDKAELINVVRKATDTARKIEKEPSLGLLKDEFVVGNDPAMDEVLRLVRKVSTTDTTVLITGETGTGKELIARIIHDRSNRSSRSSHPFIAINCAAIPDELTESELFGYEKGAFTGAVLSKPGRFELADKGTLFLDEIGTLSQKVQGKLLRVLQEKNFERVGGIKTITVDTRLIAATNTNLKAAVEEGRFREDLFYRLNVIQVNLPPLRERPGDILPLVDLFLKRFNQKMDKKVTELENDALTQLLVYHWPGNIRELENAIERAVLMTDDSIIHLEDLPGEIASVEMDSTPDSSDATLREKVKSATARLEKQMILDALEKTGNNVTKAAKILGLSRKGLQLKMKALGLRDSDS